MYHWCRIPVLLLVFPALLSAEPASLSKEERSKAIKLDEVTVPTPDELMAAINKFEKPNWQSKYRDPIPTAYTSRPQIALNLGGLIADGYIAVQAEDGQQVKNIGKDIMTLAKALGVSQNILNRGNSITEFAENNEWSALKEELEATQNEVKKAMNEQHDQELVTLVTLGGWIRGTEVVSGCIADKYSEESAKLLRQPAIVAYLREKIATLSKEDQKDEMVEVVRDGLKTIEQLISFPQDKPPTVEEVKKLHEVTHEVSVKISKKDK